VYLLDECQLPAPRFTARPLVGGRTITGRFVRSMSAPTCPPARSITATALSRWAACSTDTARHQRTGADHIHGTKVALAHRAPSLRAENSPLDPAKKARPLDRASASRADDNADIPRRFRTLVIPRPQRKGSPGRSRGGGGTPDGIRTHDLLLRRQKAPLRTEADKSGQWRILADIPTGRRSSQVDGSGQEGTRGDKSGQHCGH
jgi:hypothetical protein